MITVITIVFAICFLACWLAVMRYDIQMFQQNSYRPERFIPWAKAHILGHWRWVMLALAGLVWNKYLAILAAAILFYCAYKEYKTKYKISIAYTARVKRLYATTLVLGLALLYLAWRIGGTYVFFLDPNKTYIFKEDTLTGETNTHEQWHWIKYADGYAGGHGSSTTNNYGTINLTGVHQPSAKMYSTAITSGRHSSPGMLNGTPENNATAITTTSQYSIFTNELVT